MVSNRARRRVAKSVPSVGLNRFRGGAKSIDSGVVPKRWVLVWQQIDFGVVPKRFRCGAKSVLAWYQIDSDLVPEWFRREDDLDFSHS